MSWPSKEDEDESCIKARVEAWQEGKNLRTMLVTLHEVTPSSAGWVQVQLGDVVNPSDVKSVYRKAVLAVHPDKHQAGKSGEKLLGHVVFEALREQWEVFRKSG
jgi:cyclin G-associated kinase